MLKLRDPVLHILISYAYFKPEMVEILRAINFPYKLVLDSGAFTVWKKGKEIQVQDYCDFLKSLPVTPWRYFNLDVIGNPEKTLINYEYMLNQGLTPIPIFTRGEDYSMLDHYYKTSDVVGIGGLVGTKNNRNVVKKVMRYVGDRKVHWLGFTEMKYLKHYHPYMCDSTAWSRIARFAECKLYLGNGKDIPMRKKNFITQPDPRIIKGLRELGFDPTIFGDKSNWKAEVLFNVGFSSEIRRMLDVDYNLNVKLFLACCSPQDVRCAVKQYKKLTGF